MEWDYLRANSTVSVAQPLTFTVTPSPETAWHLDHRHQLVETATLFVPVVMLVCAYRKAKAL
jgi:hypothetical protein